MAEQALKDFLERMKTDEAFRDQVYAREDEGERVAFVNAKGYDVTAEDIAAEAGRLADERLTQAVGGVVVAAPALNETSGYVGC